MPPEHEHLNERQTDEDHQPSDKQPEKRPEDVLRGLRLGELMDQAKQLEDDRTQPAMLNEPDFLTIEQRNDELYARTTVGDGRGSLFWVRDVHVVRSLMETDDNYNGLVTWLQENPYNPDDFDMLKPLVERMNKMLHDIDHGIGPDGKPLP